MREATHCRLRADARHRAARSTPRGTDARRGTRLSLAPPGTAARAASSTASQFSRSSRSDRSSTKARIASACAIGCRVTSANRTDRGGPAAAHPAASALSASAFDGDFSSSTGFAVAGRDGGASFDGAPADLRFAAAVATFAQILRGAPEVGGVSADAVREWALLAKGDDPGGLREGFVQLVERWIDMQRPGEER